MKAKSILLCLCAITLLMVLPACSNIVDKVNEVDNTYIVSIDGVEYNIPKGEKVTRPKAPTREGYEFIGWYVGETEYDFTAAVNAPLTIVSKWQPLAEAKGKVTLTAVGSSGAIGDADIYINDEAEPIGKTDNSGEFESGLLSRGDYALTIKKAGLQDKTLEVKAADFDIGLGLSFGEVFLIKEFISLGQIGSTNSAIFDINLTRESNGTYYRFVAEESTVKNVSLDALTIFISVGEITSSTRNDDTFAFAFFLDGNVSIKNYPNGSTTAPAILTKTIWPIYNGLTNAITRVDGDYVLDVFIPAVIFETMGTNVTVEPADIMGISFVVDYGNSQYYTWNLTHSNINGGAAIHIDRTNLTKYLRLSVSNEIFLSSGNVNTVVTGTVTYDSAPMSGATVTLGGKTATTDISGGYSIVYNRADDEAVSISVSLKGYETVNSTVSFEAGRAMHTKDITLAPKIVTLTGTVTSDISPFAPLPNASVTYKTQTVQTGSNGAFSIDNVAINQTVILEVSLTNYSTKQATFTVDDLNTDGFVAAITLSPEIQGTFSLTAQSATGALAGAEIYIGSAQTVAGTTNASGVFTSGTMFSADLAITIKKSGYQDKTVNIEASSFVNNDNYDIGNVMLIKDYLQLGTIGGTADVPPVWNIGITREADGLYFKFDADSAIVTSSDSVTLFLLVGNITGATRNADTFAIVVKADGTIKADNYPNNGKTRVFAEQASPHSSGVSNVVTQSGGRYYINAFVPYSFFAQYGTQLIITKDTALGISLTSERGSKWDVWNLTHQNINGGTITHINRENLTAYLRMSVTNEIYLNTNNLNTVVSGKVLYGVNPISGATVTFDGKTATTNASGEYSFAYNRTDNITKQITVTMLGYEDNANESVSFEVGKSLYSVPDVVMTPKTITLTGTVFKGGTAPEALEGASVLISVQGSTAAITDSDGTFSIADVPINASLTVDITKEGYVQFSQTYSVAELNAVGFTVTATLLEADGYIIMGTVRDIYGLPVADVSVNLVIAGEGINETATSDTSGAFNIVLYAQYAEDYVVTFSGTDIIEKTMTIAGADIAAAGEVYTIGNTDLLYKDALDANKLRQKESIVDFGTLGGTNSTAYTVFAERVGTGIKIYALSTNNTDFVATDKLEVYTNLYGFTKARREFTKNYVFTNNGNIAINGFNGTGGGVTHTSSDVTTGVTNFVQKQYLVGYIPYTSFAYLVPDYFPVNDNTHIGFSLLSVRGSQLDVWNRANVPGIAGTSEVARGNTKNYLILLPGNQGLTDDKTNIDSSVMFDMDFMANLVESSAAYQDGLAFETNMASYSFPKVTHTSVGTVSTGNLIYSNRTLHKWDNYRIAAIEGMSFLLREPGENPTITVTSSGYLLCMAQTDTSITGWTQIMEKTSNPGVDTGYLMNFYVRYFNAGETISTKNDMYILTNATAAMIE